MKAVLQEIQLNPKMTEPKAKCFQFELVEVSRFTLGLHLALEISEKMGIIAKRNRET